MMDYANIPGTGRDTATPDTSTGVDGDSVQMIPEIVAAAAAAARTGGVPLIADANGTIVLPAGATLDDIAVVGRDLVITLDNGQVFVIPDGAVYVPQIVIDGVAVPPLNLAALLIGDEPIQPAAGLPNSSGNNFFEDAGPIQAAKPIGDLLPPTEFGFVAEPNLEVIPQPIDRDPTIGIITVNQPVAVTDATANVAESGLPARNGEPAGSNAAANTETTSGTIVFSSPDGIASLTINGTTFTGPGQTFVSPRGTLSITTFDPVAGTANFTYTLTDNVVGGTLADTFTVALTDPDGDVATSTLTINVADDAPTARNDTDAVPAGSFAAQTGNVITGTGTTSGATGADTLGADNASITRIASNTIAANTDTSFDAAGNLQVSGQYGVLTIKADGSYAFTRNPGTPGGVSDVFTYTLTDADGSASTATLTIAIADAVPVITSVPPAGSAATIVAESGLPVRTGEAPGSNAPAPTETTSGTVTFAGGDGPVTATINGVVVAVGAVVTTPTGTLTITSFDPNTGAIGYTFTLADNTPGDTTSVTFNLVVTDVDGDTAPGSFTITIVDDVPLAVNDSATQATENAAVTVNVLANDIQGADSVAFSAVTAVPGTLSGTGTLVYNSNGTFTYTPGAGEQGTVTFDYTITDGDGDTSRATVTIALLADSTPTISVAGDNTVSEAALPARGEEPAGSNAASPDETAVGTIPVTTGGDTLASLVINGTNVTTGGTVTTAKGVLTVTRGEGGAYSYSYTLADNTLADPDSDTFSVTVTDSDGDTASTSLVIAIADDTPTARDDAGSVAAGTYGPISGSVTANDTPGADGIVVLSYARGDTSAAAGATLQGQYGTLSIAANGTYSYTRDAGTPGGVSDTFAYTVRDGDGDPATANLVITIADSGTTLTIPVAGTPGSTQVLEAGLPAGSAAATDGEFASGTFNFTAPDGPATVTIGGTVVTTVGQTIAGSFGTLTVTSIASGAIGYTYQLTTNTSGDTTSDAFAVTVTDQDGDASSGTLTIAIVDDIPTARADVDSVAEDGPLVADGNVITGSGGTDLNATDGVADTRGADGASVTAVSFGNAAGTVGGATAGTYGNLTLNADGSYSYALNNANLLVQGLDDSEVLTETFNYTLTDGDTDTSSTTLTITITGTNDAPVVGVGAATVSEEGLGGANVDAVGNTDTTDSASFGGTISITDADGEPSTVTLGDPGAVLTSGGTTVTWSGIGTGTLTGSAGDTPVIRIAIDNLGAYTVTLLGPVDQATADVEDVKTFTVPVSVSDGTATVPTTLTVTIEDDSPLAANDTDAVTEDGPTSATGNVLTGVGSDGNAAGADSIGADGPAAGGAVVALAGGTVGSPLAGTYGSLTLNATGGYTYTLDNALPAVQGLDTGETLSETFTYTIRDRDGDTATATLTVTINGTNDAPVVGTGTATVSEEGLKGANVDAVGNTDTTDSASFTGTISITDADGEPSTVTLGDPGAVLTSGGTTVTWSGIGTGTLTGSANGGDVIRVVIDNAGNYTVTLLGPVDQATANVEDVKTFVVPVSVSDGTATVPTTLTVTIEDDSPLAANDTDAVTEDGPTSATGNVLTGVGSDGNAAGADSIGADGPAAGGVVTAIAGGTVGSALAGIYGSITLNADGSYTYALNNADPRVQGLDGNDTLSETFTYTISDRDGDTATATLVVTINGANDPVTITGLNVEGGEETVLEANLADGSAPNAGALTQTGTFSVAGIDGIASIAVGGLTVFSGGTVTTGQTFNAAFGTLTITSVTPVVDAAGDTVSATIAYSYTLNDNTLTHPAAGSDAIFDSFAVSVTDSDGSTATDSLDVKVVDDIPTAAADADSVKEDGPLVADGNVISGSGGSDLNATDGVRDTQGADGAAVSAVSFGNTAGTVGNALAGTYGSLTLNADGGYAYTLNNTNPLVQGLDKNQTLTETFAYTLRDGDGDTSPSTLTITILGTDDGVTLTGLNVEGGEQTVFEANLSDGSAPDAGALTQSGSFTTAGIDGIATIVVGGKTVFTGGAFVAGQTVVTAQGTLTITAVTPVTDGAGDTVSATVTYSYTLNDNTLGHTAAGNDSIFDSFVVTVTDTDGSTATDSLDVKVVDDVPTARADADSVTEDGALVADGNVITGGGGTDANVTDGVLDTKGADGAVVSAVSFGNTAGTVGSALAGTYGSLTLNADGSYAYMLNNTNPLVQGLNGNQTLTEVFAYTLRDGDADTSPTTLTVTINGANDPVTITGLDIVGGEETVFEANLSDGSAPSMLALTQTGTFSVAGIDGITSIVVGGATVFTGGAFVPGQVMNAAFGTLTITSVTPVTDANGDTVSATIAYSYTLNDNTLTHPAAGADSIFDSFAVSVTDSDGSTATDSLDVKVVDDTPTANPDTNMVDEGATTTGNVLTDGIDDVFGADGRATTVPAGGVVAVNGGAPGTPIVTALGTLTLLADGSYTYVAKPNTITVDTTDSFTYTIRDADGDVSTTTLVISLKAVNGVVTDVDVDVDEAGLPVIGSAAAGNGEFDTNGQITVTGATGPFTYTLTGSPPVPYGTLTLNSTTGAYSYTLTRPFDNATVNDGAVKINGVEGYGYRVTDQFGNVIGTGTISVNVVDDIPTARSDTAITVAEDGANVGGNLLANDTQGADGAIVTSVRIGNVTTAVPAAGTVTITTVTGQYTFQANGTWTFNPDPDQSNDTVPVSAGFTYTITDGDGDQSSAAQVINIVDGANPMAGTPITLTVDDQNLANGSTPAAVPPVTASGTIAFVQGSDSISTIVFDTDISTLTAGNLTWMRVSGTQIVGKDAGSGLTVVTLDLVRSGNSATITATLSNNFDAHPALGDDLAALGFVNVVATDGDGDFVKTAVNVQVSDDIPTARDDTATQAAENAAFTIDALVNDTRGADGVNTADAAKVFVVTNATYGVVSYSTATGLFTYTPNAGAGSLSLSDSFTYRIVDGDGDISTATVSITLQPDSAPMVKTTTNLSVDEDGFPAHNPDGGTLLHPAETAGSNSLTDLTGSAVVNFGNDVPSGLPASIVLVDLPAYDTQLKTLDGAAVTFAIESGALVGRSGGVEAIRIAITGATTGPLAGDVTYTYSTTLSQPLQHTATGEDTVTLSGVTFRVTDSDSDTTTGSFNVAILDDVPSIDVTKGTETGVLLTTQDAETIGVLTDTAVSSARFGGVFALASVAGSDGTATAPTLAYTLAVTNAASGLTSGGVAITLALSGTTVVGSAGGTPVFSIAVASDGTVTLSQFQQIDHPIAGDPNTTDTTFDDHLAILGDGLITLTASATITDRDGDTVSDSETIDLGGNIRFADDGPVLTNVAAGAAVSVDETAAGVNFATPVSMTSATAAITATSAFGADGMAASGATTYGLTIVGGGVTTLQTALGDQAITLIQTSATTITGQYGAGLTAFTLTINPNGTTTLTQTVALEHNQDGNTAADYNDTLTLAGLVNATITLTDFDGDTATASAGIGGNVTFFDDGVLVAPDGGTVPAGSAAAIMGNVLTNDYRGADGSAITAVSNTAAGTSDTTTDVDGNFVLNGQFGTLTLNATTGVYTYLRTAGAGGGASDVFSYTLTDNDGDFASTTLTIAIGDLLPVATTASATVDDEGLGGILGGTGDLDANATDAGPNVSEAVFQGTLGGTLGDGTNTFAFTATQPLLAQTIGQETVTYAVTGGGSILTATIATSPAGRTGVLFTAQITDTATGAYTLTLAQPVLHLTLNTLIGDDEENDAGVALGYQLTDADLDVSTAGVLTVTFDDDIPTATAFAVTQATENAAITIDLTGRFAAGADGLATITATNGMQGNVTVSGNSLIYTPISGAGSPSAGTSDSFTYTITDKDGDSVSQTVNVTLQPDSVPIVNNAVAAVDDDGLVGGNPANPGGDIDANTGEPGATASEAVYTGQLNVSYGNDTGSVSFANLHNTTGMVGIELVTYTWNAGTSLLTATGPRGPLFTVSLSPSGAYTVTLLDNVLHAPGGNESSAPVVDLFYRAADNDTSPDANLTGKLSITFNDDAPSNFTPVAASAINTGTAILSGALDNVGMGIFDNAGADGIGSIAFASTINETRLTGASGNLQSGGQDIFLYIQPDGSLIASTDTNPADGLTGALTVFTATLDAVAGTYSIDFDRTIDNGSGVQAADFSAAAAGNTPWKGVDPDILNGATLDIASPLDPNPNSTDLLFTPIGGGAQNTINSDSDDIGIGTGQTVDTPEALRIDLVQNLRRDPGKSESDADGYLYTTHSGVSQFTFSLIQVNGNAAQTGVVRIRAFNVDDNDPLSQSNVGAAANTPVNLDPSTVTVVKAPGNVAIVTIYEDGDTLVISGLQEGDDITFGAVMDATFEAVVIENANGDTFDPGPAGGPTVTVSGNDFSLGGFAFSFVAIGDPVAFSLPVVLTDGDGDTSTGSISVSLDPVTPVVLDMDGDGKVEFAPIEAGAAFDYNGDGNLAATAWVGKDDGILALDGNGNGSVDDGSEIVFGGGGLTDLEGLAASYGDTLDTADADFAKFGVWQDANGNGVSDAGEFHTLGEAGITSIGLVSDGVAYTAANGDVTVAGSATYTRADGSTGTVADAAFATAALDKLEAKTAELTAANAAAAGVLAAAAAVAALPVAATEVAPAATAGADLPATGAVQTLSETHEALRPLTETPASHEAAKAAPAETASLGDEAQASASNLAEPADHAASAALAGAGDDAGANPVAVAAADFGGAGGQLMEALLAAAQAAKGGVAEAGQHAQDLAAVQEAFGDSHGTAMVDAMVDHFAGAESALSAGGEDALAALMAANVGGADSFGPAFDLNQLLSDMSAHAAAQV